MLQRHSANTLGFIRSATSAADQNHVSIKNEVKTLSRRNSLRGSSSSPTALRERSVELDWKMDKTPPRKTSDISVVLSAQDPIPTAIKVKELYSKIKHMHSDDILTMLEHSYASLDRIHLAACLKRLFTVGQFMKNSYSNDYRLHVQSSKGFQVLCFINIYKYTLHCMSFFP
jgi:hypothetical protein